MRWIAIVMATSVAAAGCATKTYGRQGPVTSFERESMSCREIDLEIARTRGFIDQVNTESQFSGRDVLAILGDFGIGNAMERDAALTSANSRISQLGALRLSRGCGASYAFAAPVSAEAPSAQAAAPATNFQPLMR